MALQRCILFFLCFLLSCRRVTPSHSHPLPLSFVSIPAIINTRHSHLSSWFAFATRHQAQDICDRNKHTGSRYALRAITSTEREEEGQKGVLRAHETGAPESRARIFSCAVRIGRNSIGRLGAAVATYSSSRAEVLREEERMTRK